MLAVKVKSTDFKKSRCLARGGQERISVLPGLFLFERLTFLSKIENRLKRGENLCENFTGRDILNFQEMSG